MRFLNKACVQTGSSHPWMLCTVTQVEETKQMLRMIPILIATFLPSVMVAQCNTLFIKQGTTLDRNIGKFKLPAASLNAFVTISMLVCIAIYDRYLVTICKGGQKTQEASLSFKEWELDHGLVENGAIVPKTVFILLPQFVLMGAADACLEAARAEFFYDQAPENMKSLGTSYSMTSMGIGNFLSTCILSLVSDITKKHGHKGWILNNLNASHLDYYFALLAVLSALNFIFFVVMTKFYSYKAEISDSMDMLREELERPKYRVAYDLALT
ncbi:hypothetical protein F0562_000546 [Nyssa sinensis]|uniref:Major facilitator superfamily (MFS) profile domain-containing protein n=1 Tax=Nyssa sinensis TaxID=561372 RepID=A0A5J5C4N9_9ASTE|nr:hypothetical protein F0562_000546 [Nyssa sinensis]